MRDANCVRIYLNRFCREVNNLHLLIDFSLTVKAATLISYRGAVRLSSAKQGKSGSIYNLVKNNKLFGPRKRSAYIS